jgi:hypothetical protein
VIWAWSKGCDECGDRDFIPGRRLCSDCAMFEDMLKAWERK